jgi:hypothetical protein
MKITIAAGHNRVPNKGASGILDEDKCTRETAKVLNDILLKRGHEVYDVTPYDRIFPSSADALRAESEAVNRIMPDLHICIHYNAFNKVSEGTEVLVYSEQSKAYSIAVKVLDSIVQAIGTKSRGVKVRSDLHILRVTKCPAILTEGLFIDNANDCKKYNAMKIATAIADAVVGKEATKMGTKIEGKSIASASDLAKFLLKRNPSPRISCTALQLATMFISEGEAEGIRGDIAFCQALHETGNFKYGGLVLPEQNNFCGLGATNNSAVGKGAWFNTPQEGIKAQIQHLKAYANDKPVLSPILDPRFDLVKPRGKAPNWEDLAGKWAFPGYNASKYKTMEDAFKDGATYGQTILKIYDLVEKSEPTQSEDTPSSWASDSWQWGIEQGVTDGSKPKFNPTREQVVQMLYNYSKKQ